MFNSFEEFQTFRVLRDSGALSNVSLLSLIASAGGYLFRAGSGAFQDVAGTLPADTINDPVGRVEDEVNGVVAATQPTADEKPAIGASGGFVFDGVNDSLVMPVPSELQVEDVAVIIALKTTDTDFRGLIVHQADSDRRIATIINSSDTDALGAKTVKEIYGAGVKLFNPISDDLHTVFAEDNIQILHGMGWDLSAVPELTIGWGGTSSRHFAGEMLVSFVPTTDQAVVERIARQLATDLSADWQADKTVEQIIGEGGEASAFLDSGEINGQWREHNYLSNPNVVDMATFGNAPSATTLSNGVEGASFAGLDGDRDFQFETINVVAGVEYTLSIFVEDLSGFQTNVNFTVATAFIDLSLLTGDIIDGKATVTAVATGTGIAQLRIGPGASGSQVGNRPITIGGAQFYRSDNGGMQNAGTFNADAPKHPFDTSFMWQDEAETTPVENDGDPIALYKPNGIGLDTSLAAPLISSTADEQPLFDKATGLFRYDGTDDNLKVALTHWTTEQRQNMTFECLYQYGGTGTQVIIGASESSISHHLLTLQSGSISAALTSNAGSPSLHLDAARRGDLTDRGDWFTELTDQNLHLLQMVSLDLSSPEWDSLSFGTYAGGGWQINGLAKPLFLGPTPGTTPREKVLYRNIRAARYLQQYARIGLSYD